MKKILYICLGALLGLFVGLVYNQRSQAPKTTEKLTAPLVAKRSEILPARTKTSQPSLEVGSAALARKQSTHVVPVVLGTRGAPADYALVKIAYKHPELSLEPEEAADLQEIFSSHYMLFSGFQAKIAHATPQPDGSTLIQIPAFPAQGQQLVESLMADVRSYYKGDVPAGVMEAIVEAYHGYTNSTGQTPVSLTVTVSEDPNYSYAVKRRTVSLDPVTGAVRAVGESSDVITRNEVLYSPYSELSPMFPKPRG